MHLSSLILLLGIILTRVAAFSVPRTDRHIADFRAYTEPDCPAPSGGIFTITQSKLGCHRFDEYFKHGERVYGVYGVNVRADCKIVVYMDERCSGRVQPVPVGSPNKCLMNGVAGWGSFSVVC